MLNIDRLLKLASGAQVEPDPTDPTRPDHEKRKSGQQSLGGPWVNPTDPTDPTKKTAVATIQDAGAETPLSDHAVDDWRCPLGHREFWISAYGLKICSRCNPNPLELRAAWLAGQGQGGPHV